MISSSLINRKEIDFNSKRGYTVEVKSKTVICAQVINEFFDTSPAHKAAMKLRSLGITTLDFHNFLHTNTGGCLESPITNAIYNEMRQCDLAVNT